MPALIRVPVEEADLETPIEVGGVRHVLRVTWSFRARDWRLSLYDLDGVAVFQGRRVSPGGVIDRVLGQAFYSYGEDGYSQSAFALGALVLALATEEELDALDEALGTSSTQVALV